MKMKEIGIMLTKENTVNTGDKKNIHPEYTIRNVTEWNEIVEENRKIASKPAHFIAQHSTSEESRKYSTTLSLFVKD